MIRICDVEIIDDLFIQRKTGIDRKWDWFIVDKYDNLEAYGLNPGLIYLDWNRSSGWLESWEGLLFANDFSTTCVEAIFRVKW